MTAYYNEIDPYAAQWLRNLIAAGLIAAGDVDERDIRNVWPDDLRKYTQCHFFAGIGGWSAALRLAGWPDDREVWTGSCPCQPFSGAGRGLGFTDERHLWPHWYHLITECEPVSIFGEQVASKDVDVWIDLVQTDLEAMGYAFGCVPFPAASIGSPNIRDRTYWVADSDGPRSSTPLQRFREAESPREPRSGVAANRSSSFSGMGDAGYGERRGRDALGYTASESGSTTDTGETAGAEWQRAISDITDAGSVSIERPSPTNGFWSAADWLLCRDGKWRPVEPGTFPLADGISNRVGRLRAYGNAINPRQAAEFVKAFLEYRP